MHVLVQEEDGLLLSGLLMGVEVADGDQADKLAIAIDHRQVPDAPRLHGGAGLVQRRIRRTADLREELHNCHQIANKGARIGPQLDGIGIRGIDRFLEDTLDPNRNVDQAFRTTILTLNNGQSLSGLPSQSQGRSKGGNHGQVSGMRRSLWFCYSGKF